MGSLLHSPFQHLQQIKPQTLAFVFNLQRSALPGQALRCQLRGEPCPLGPAFFVPQKGSRRPPKD